MIVDTCALPPVMPHEEDRAQDRDGILAAVRPAIEPVTQAQALLAREAYRVFGTGRHPAGSNLDHCLAHAPARERGEPPPFKGDDRARTDAKRAF